MDLESSLRLVESFSSGTSLTERISDIEATLPHKNKKQIEKFLNNEKINSDVLQGALKIKEVAGQINVVIHSVGILVLLSSILDENEEITYLSLGAGNTGKNFDLETNKRIAEFKFINWRGGADSIRQNSLFIDLFNLVEHETDKRRCLYVIDKKHPIRFLYGQRSINSILSKNQSVNKRFFDKYGDKYKIVSEYYRDISNMVEIIDVNDIVPYFCLC